MPVPKPIPLIASNGIIKGSGKSSKLMVITPIIAETTIKDNPIRLLFTITLNFL